MLTVFIPGHPKPQGSKVLGQRKDGKAFMREANSKARPWRSVVIEALKPLATEPLGGAVRVHLHFYMPLLKKTPQYPITRSSYDVDKLARNMLDAITQAGIIKDDSQVVSLITTKEYAERSGVQIRVENYTDFLDRFWE
jgi:Holliday junction resolvase RusA-like endonuclease